NFNNFCDQSNSETVLVNIDSIYNCKDVTISEKVVMDLENKISTLLKLGTIYKSSYLLEIKKLFTKYLRDKEIQLTKLLDPDFGIFYLNGNVRYPIPNILLNINFENSWSKLNVSTSHYQHLILKLIASNIETVYLNKVNFDQLKDVS